MGIIFFLRFVNDRNPSTIPLKNIFIFLILDTAKIITQNIKIETIKIVFMFWSMLNSNLSSKNDSRITSYWSSQTRISINKDIVISIILSAAIVPKVFPIGILLYSLNIDALTSSPDLGIAILDV